MSQAEKLPDMSVDELRGVEFVETMTVKDGVECDVYKFEGDDSKDLAIVRVQQGCKTPLQRVLSGDKTIEGHIKGTGRLTITSEDGTVTTYDFMAPDHLEVEVEVGQTMQWHANGDSDLTFYEVCSPPYQDGRFENLPE